MFFYLNKEAFKRGKKLGALSSDILYERVSLVKKNQKQRKIPETLSKARIKDFTRILKKISPHWLEEAAGIAAGSGIDTSDILMLNCLHPDLLPHSGNNCTSFMLIAKHQNILFKIRDEYNYIQQFFIYPFQGNRYIHNGRDIGNLGAAHAFTSEAIAFANNTGSSTELIDDSVRLNDCHILRYFSEVIENLNDIPKAFEFLMKHNAAGGAGKKRGCIFLIVDREKGLILETVADNYAITWVNKGVKVISNHFVSNQAKKWISNPPDKNTITRKKRMEELLSRFDNSPTPSRIFYISRDRKHFPHALCNDDKKHSWMTVSAQLQIIEKESPDLSKNYICCGNTRYSIYFPFPVDYKKNFHPLISGEFYKYSDKLYKNKVSSKLLKKSYTDIEKQIFNRNDYETLYKEMYEKFFNFEL